ncbi:cyanobacterial porin [Chroococcidiopsis thermalis PCC 7203]|uniref:Cyanobacterial porin n=1 Tax=Chroococcidiopsis thermalis (strain PCC 7203) TaxID=251229 RepID=K9TU76_CHRTP|nr:cyanobacterial porin [Chroococcidiopsis thermalis PCC 7203]
MFLVAGIVLQIISNNIRTSIFVFGATLALTNSVFASELKQENTDLERANNLSSSFKESAPYEANSLERITPVSQLDNISARDWQWQTLKSLSQRYNTTIDFNGDRSFTRYEFASTLDAVLTEISKLIATGDAERVSQADITKLQRLQTEFAAELANLQTRRVEGLESQTQQLEAQQFSTTTTLSGQVIFAVSSAFGDEKADGSSEKVDSNLVLSDRVRLTFNTSFMGEDRLRVRIQANNFPGVEDATGTTMARLGFEGDSENQFELTRIEYRFPVGEQTTVYAGVFGSGIDDFADTVNSFLDSSSRGAISRFGRRNPIYRQGSGTGVGVEYDLTEEISLQLGYVAEDANEPESGIGGSAYGAIAQLYFEYSDRFELGLTYIHSYNQLDTGTGSELANDPFDENSDAIRANSYGVATTWQINPKFAIGGWMGLTNATAADLPGNPTAEIFNYAITLAFPDLGKEGSLGGIVIGQPPKVTNSDLSTDFQDRNTAWHFEAFYRFKFSEQISMTPGFLVIINPEHDNNNDTLYVGTIRTTFEF